MSSRVRYATSIILTRGTIPELEVYLVERAPELRFFGGYWAFPGGGVEAADKDAETAPDARAFARCALRELFEETGLLHAELDAHLAPGDRAALRRDLLEGRSLDRFRSLLDRAPRVLSHVQPVCRLTTPAFIPIRFATDFVRIELPEPQSPRIEAGELVQGQFLKPGDAVARWKRGELMIAPPVIYLLELLADAADFDEFLAVASAQSARIEDGALHELRFTPGITLAPLRTPTLPPATTTNCLIAGRERMYLIDPAPYEEREQQLLFDKVDEYLARGHRLEGVLLTHHHSDHIGAVNAASERYDIPVHAHALTLDRIPSGYRRGRDLADGDRIELGRTPDGRQDWHLRCLHTPGHDRGHLCFLDNHYHIAIVGDMLSTVSTIIIDPPEGHLRSYLSSLERLLVLPIRTVYPAHGPARQDAHALIREYLEHRRERESALMEALRNGAGTTEELLPLVYADAPESVYPYAERSLLAGLEKLAEEQRATVAAGRWSLLA